MMKRHDVDGLLVPHLVGDDYHKYAGYLSEACFCTPGGTSGFPAAVLLPETGDPVTFGALPTPGAWISDNIPPGHASMGQSIVRKIRERGLADKRLGVIGTEPGSFGLTEFFNSGLMMYSVFQEVVETLPDAEFIDLTAEMAEVIIVKGEEEITRYREAALLGEKLHEMLLDFIEPGMDPNIVRLRVSEFFIMNGAKTNVAIMPLRGTLQKGQVIPTEYGIKYKGGYCQVTLSMAIGEVSILARALADIAEASLQHALATIKPGKTFGEVIGPLEKIVADSGFTHGFPQMHGIGPIALVGPVGRGPKGDTYSETLGADIVLRPGIMLSLENGARQFRKAEVRVGGTGVVTENGFDLFNTLGRELRVAKG
jgi:Xaa-Pro aminopeptidase